MTEEAERRIKENLETKNPELNLTNCEITGKEEALSLLKDATHVEFIYLYENQIEDVSFLKNLTQVQKLILTNNQIKDISPLKNLTQLQELVLTNNQIKDISPLKSLIQLQELFLANNQIKDISPLKNLTQLQDIVLNHNQIQNISVLQNFRQLRLLGIENNPIQNITPLKTVKSLINGIFFEISLDLLPYPPIWYVYFKVGNLMDDNYTLGNYTHLEELPEVEKIWQIMYEEGENTNLAHQLAISQGWTEENFETYKEILYLYKYKKSLK